MVIGGGQWHPKRRRLPGRSSSGLPERDWPATLAAQARIVRQSLRQPADLDSISVREWFDRVGMPASAREASWDLLAIGVLNEKCELASAKAFADIISTFVRLARSQRLPVKFGYPAVDFDTLYVDGARRLILERGGEVRHRAIARRVTVENGLREHRDPAQVLPGRAGRPSAALAHRADEPRDVQPATRDRGAASAAGDKRARPRACRRLDADRMAFDDGERGAERGARGGHRAGAGRRRQRPPAGCGPGAGMKPEKRMSAVARREQLLDLALAVVATEGFMGLSIDRVAQDAGVTRTLVYHQFATLDGLAMALVEREAEAAMRALTAIPAPDAADLQQAMTQFTAAVLVFGREAPLRWQVLLNPPDGGPPELHE